MPISWLVLTMALEGPGDHEEGKLSGQELAALDELPSVRVTCTDTTAAQCCSHLSRKCEEAAMVSSMVSDTKCNDLDPNDEELGTWFATLVRKRGKIKGSVSLRC